MIGLPNPLLKLTAAADSSLGTFVCVAGVSERCSFSGTPSPLAPLRPPTRVPGAAGPELPGSSLLPRRSSGQARVRPGPRPRSPPDPRGCCTGCRSRCCCCRRGHPTLGPPLRRSWTHRPPRLPLFPRRKAPPPLLPRWRGRGHRGWAAICSSTPTGSPTRTRCSWRRNLGARRSARRPRESQVLARAIAAQSALVSLRALCGCRATVCRTRTSSPLLVVLVAKLSSDPATCRGTAPPTVRALVHLTPARSVHAASRTPRSWRSTCACTELSPALSGSPHSVTPTHTPVLLRLLPYPRPQFPHPSPRRNIILYFLPSSCVM
ncbi:zinc finger protein 580 isoform X1 [Mus musculus]|uniref:zinc finger protein 580 isoform X1 n=1 Tax=Mus musculus TaxID=10090 RepID=UPI0011AE41FD|nr:zinc finger protein 580 isoform X1 [Mus musculus]